ncbi:ATP synthase subunit I [Paucibacter sp. B51]|uniref:ATP synthase subunit I n=1 Tax=Paucibacter sp. B51 TaxID=2993315 RepID=UPI0022EBBCBB|nr:ATP synthase subunit I [Paucibacter sp. B51]
MSEFEGDELGGHSGARAGDQRSERSPTSGPVEGSKTAQPASSLTLSPGSSPERKFRQLAWDDEVSEDGSQDGAAEAAFKTLTREEAQALVAQHPPLSPWRVVGAQAVIGVLLTVLWGLGAWLVGDSSLGGMEKARSALCGVAAVVLPNALMAWGMTGLFRGIPGAAVLGFMFWELIKIMLAVAILAAAAKWMPGLYWPALLVGLIGCLKVNWVALLLQGRFSKNRVAASHAKRDGN